MVGRRRVLAGGMAAAALSGCMRLGNRAAAPQGATKHVTLRLPWPESDGLAKALVHGYGAVEPGVTLQPTAFGSGGDPAHVDLFELWSISEAVALGGQAFADLNPLLATLNADLGALLPGMADLYSLQGRRFGLPFAVSHTVVAVRQDAIDRWRLDTDWRGWDVAALRDVCLGIRAAGHDPLDRDGLTTVDAWTAFIAGYGGGLKADGVPDPTRPGTLAGLGQLAELVRIAGSPPKAWTQYAPSAPITLMDSQTLAMRQLFRGAPVPDVVAARFPRMPVFPVIPAQSPALAVTRVCREPLAAARLLLWLLGPDGQHLVEAQRQQSVRRDMADSGVWAEGLPHLTDAGGMVADPSAYRIVPFVSGRYELAVQAVLQGAAISPNTLGPRLAALAGGASH